MNANICHINSSLFFFLLLAMLKFFTLISRSDYFSHISRCAIISIVCLWTRRLYRKLKNLAVSLATIVIERDRLQHHIGWMGHDSEHLSSKQSLASHTNTVGKEEENKSIWKMTVILGYTVWLLLLVASQ